MPDATDILTQWEAVCEAATKGPWEFRQGVDHRDRSVDILVAQVGVAAEDEDQEWDEVLFGQSFGETQVGNNWDFIAAARTGWPATLRALKVLMEFAEHENSLWGDPENPAAKALAKAKAILEGRDDQA